MNPSDYNAVIGLAAELCDDALHEGLSSDYVRGQCELICDLFALGMANRKQVLEDMKESRWGKYYYV